MSRISHKERERIKTVASKMTVVTGEAKAHSLHRLVKRLVLKSCGKHYGESGGDCHKCRKPDCRTKEGLLAVLNATFYPNTW